MSGVGSLPGQAKLRWALILPSARSAFVLSIALPQRPLHTMNCVTSDLSFPCL